MNWDNNPQNPLQSFVVKASAGSGKTYQLSRRFVYLVASGSEPDEILTITFTRKAASEMKERILRLADELRQGREFAGEFAQSCEQLKSRARMLSPEKTAQKIFSAAARLQVTTIDSCFYDWYRRFYFDPSLPSDGDYEMAPMAELRACEESAWQGLCQDFCSPTKGDATSYVEIIMRRDGPMAVRERLRMLARHRSLLWLHGLEGEPPILPFELRGDIQSEAELMAAIGEPLAVLLPTLSEKVRASVESALASGSYAALMSSPIITQRGTLSGTYVSKKKRAEYPEETAAIDAALIEFSDLQKTILLNGEAMVYRELYQAFDRQRDEQKIARRLVEFDDLARSAYKIMHEPEFLGARYFIQRQTRHLLIDEFQDTSHLQWAIFKELAEEILAGQGIENGTVFIVGDPKQSIYGFREADPHILSEVATALPALTPVNLSVSYRSAKPILDYVNGYFAERMPDFPAHAAANQDGRLLTPSEASVTVIDKTDDEADSVVTAIAAMLEQKDPIGIYEGQDLRPVRARDITVLFRASTRVEALSEKLHERHIPYVVDIDQKLDALPIWRDLSELLRFLAFPEDLAAMLSVLKSPLVGMGDEELMSHLRRWQMQATYWYDYLANCQDELCKLMAEAMLGKPRAWLSRLHQILRDPKRTRRLWNGLNASATAVERSAWEGVIAFLSDYSATCLSPLELREQLQKTFDDDSSAYEFPVAADAVRLMSIHKSKGLEFPVVMLYDAGSAWEKSEPYWAKGESQLGKGVFFIGRKNERPQKHAQFTSVLETLESDERAESERLVYVALTRAKQHLFISGSEPARNKPESSIYDKCLATFNKLYPDASTINTGKLSARRYYMRDNKAERIEVAGTKEAEEPWPRVASFGNFCEYQSLRPTAELAKVSNKALGLSPYEIEQRRLEGLYIHKLLELEIEDEAKAANVWRYTVDQNSSDPQFWYDYDFYGSYEIYRKFVNSQLWQELQASIKHSYNEVSFCELHGDAMLRGICDLVVEKRDGSIWVYDFKTSPELDETKAAAYRPQLKRYANTLSTIYPGKKIHTALLSVVKGSVYEVDCYET